MVLKMGAHQVLNSRKSCPPVLSSISFLMMPNILRAYLAMLHTELIFVTVTLKISFLSCNG